MATLYKCGWFERGKERTKTFKDGRRAKQFSLRKCRQKSVLQNVVVVEFFNKYGDVYRREAVTRG